MKRGSLALSKVSRTLAANPWVYDQIQRLAGREKNPQIMRAYIAPVYSAACVLGAGGGTGNSRHFWPVSCDYICLDNDLLKLRGLAGQARAKLGTPGRWDENPD